MLDLEPFARISIRTFALAVCRRRLRIAVRGREHVPAAGPLLLASHHYHHLYDSAALLAVVPRPLHFLVALDWVRGSAARRLMEWACRTARWPAVLRAERVATSPGPAYGAPEVRPYLRRGLADGVALLQAGRALCVFPEGYPNVDPAGSVKGTEQRFLPFRPGFARLVELAQREAGSAVPIVPVGLDYRPGPRWRLNVRFGAPLWTAPDEPRRALVARLERTVRELSSPG